MRRSANVLIYVLIAASIFWITATVAQWSGRGLAEYDAQHFDSLPSVILDTKERLFLRDPGIEEQRCQRRKARRSTTVTGTCDCSSRVTTGCFSSRTTGRPATRR